MGNGSPVQQEAALSSGLHFRWQPAQWQV